MEHVDPEVLALRALGEDVGGAGEDAHVRACARCRSEIDELREVADLARSMRPEDHVLEAPPQRVWARIAEATGVEASGSHRSAERGPAAQAGAPGRERRDESAPASDLPRDPDVEVAAGAGAGAGAAAQLPDAYPHERSSAARPWMFAAAAAVVALLVVAAAVVVAWPGAEPAGELIAETSLDPLDADAPGEARLVAVEDTLRLEVSPGALPDFDGYYALWLIDTDVEQMISLGPLVEDAVHDLPDGLDPAVYPVVDVSREPFDGDPTHSGDSILRGTLPVE